MSWGNGKRGWSRGEDTFRRLATRDLHITIQGLNEIIPGGIIRNRQKTAYDTGTGIWLGIDSDGAPKFGVGDLTNYLQWDPTNGLVIAGDGSGLTQINGGNIQTGTITADSIATGTITFEKLISGTISDNLIVDAGFESGSLSTIHSAVHSGGTWSVQSTITRSGSYALKYDPTGQTADASLYLNGDPDDPGYLNRHVQALAGRTYTLEFWGYRAASQTTNRIRIYTNWYNAIGSLISSNYNTFDPATWTDDTWDRNTTTKTAPSGTAYVVWEIRVLNDGNADPVYIDDIIARAQIGTAYIEAGAVTATEINVSQLSAIAADMGTLTAGIIQDTNSKFTIDLNNRLITITDEQASPTTRVKIGELGTGLEEWGIEIYDDTGSLILGATGLGTGVVNTSQIAAGAVTAAKIQAGTITSNELAANSVTTTQIAAGAVTADKLNVSQLSAIAADMGSLTAGEIVVGTTNKLWLNEGGDGDLAIGGTDKTSAPFRVNELGQLTATDAVLTSTGRVTIKAPAFASVQYYDGTTYFDNTTEAQTSAGTSFTSLKDSDDFLYLGMDTPFSTIYASVPDGDGIYDPDFSTLTLQAEYFNGAWTTLAITDNTTVLSQSGTITFTNPADWSTTTVNGATAYFIRLSLSRTPEDGGNLYSISPTTGERFYIYAQKGDTQPAIIVDDQGRVGIGTVPSGNNLLHISTQYFQSNNIVELEAPGTNNYMTFQFNSNPSVNAPLGRINFQRTGTTNAAIISQRRGSAGEANIIFYTHDGTSLQEALRIDPNRRVMISGGVPQFPDYTLDVAGDAGFDEYIFHNDDGDTYIRFQPDQIDFVAGGNTGITIDSTGLVTLDKNIAFKSGTAFKATFDHTLTADRTITVQDASGTLALIADVQEAHQRAWIMAA